MDKKIFSKYKRGDVWYIKFQTEDGDGLKGSSVQKKSRPHVIVSCEENNNNSPVFQVVPIATMKPDHLPPHVYFRNGERDQTIMCEQITTVSILDLQREGSHFMYSFNLEFINKIDEALASQLGLRVRVADMKVLENLINKISEQKELELKNKYENSIKIKVEELADRLSKKFGISLTSEDVLNGRVYDNPDLVYAPKELIDKMKKTAAERMNPEKESIANEENKVTLPWDKSKSVSVGNLNNSSSVNDTSSTTTKKKRNKWTKEKMIQFLKDKESMTISDLAEKYNIQKKSVYTLEYTFKHRLNDDKK